MGLTSNLGKLSSIITSTGSAVGIAQSSPSYTLDVTGTGRFTGNVGIGIAPLERLTISGSNGLAGMIRWTDSATASAFIGITSGGVAYIHSNNNTLAFGANGSNNFAETMRLSSGNVGIGTSSPLNVLDVRQASAIMGNYQTIQAFSTDSAAINLGGGISLGGYYTGTSSIAQFGSIVGRKENGTSANYDGYLAFGTNAQATGVVERMRITSGGQLLIGGTASLYSNTRLSVKQTTANLAAEIWSNYGSDFGSPALTIIKNDNNTTQVFQRFAIDNGNAANGQINGNGASQAAFGTWSDRRLKDNIVDLPSQLSNILALRPVEFDYKNGSGHQIGFIAQEMQEVYPDSVGEDSDGFLTITGWSKTESRLVKAIQEMAAQIEELKSFINK